MSGQPPELPPQPTADVIDARPIAATPPPPRPQLPGLPILSMLSRRDAAYDLMLVLFVALIIPFGQQVISLLADSGWSDMRSAVPAQVLHWLLIRNKWISAFIVVGLSLYLLHRHRLPARCLGVHTQNLGKQTALGLVVLVGVYGATIVTIIVVMLCVLLLPGLEKDLAQRAEFFQLIPKESLGATIMLLVPVAIEEELLFRGLLLPYLRRVGCSWTLAIVISTSIFAVMHVAQGGLAIFQVFVLGAAFAVGFLVTRSLLAVIIAHFLFNLIQIQLATRVFQWLEESLTQ